MPRTKCPVHGVKRIEVPWARPGSDFTLLFEQAAMSLVKEMPVLAVSRQLEISDKRLWRIVHHYVGRMLGELDLSNVATVGVDETASRRGQRYVTVFLGGGSGSVIQRGVLLRGVARAKTHGQSGAGDHPR